MAAPRSIEISAADLAAKFHALHVRHAEKAEKGGERPKADHAKLAEFFRREAKRLQTEPGRMLRVHPSWA